MALATGQITLVDLTDLPSLQGYLTSNLSKMQFLTKAGVYTPNWVNAPSLVISAELYSVGSGSNIIEDSRVTDIKWYKNGVLIAASGSNITLVPTVTGNLKNTSIKIDANLLTAVSPALKITCEIFYKHAPSLSATPIKLDIDYLLSTQGEQGIVGPVGPGAIQVIMSNESATLPASETGVVSDYTKGVTTIRLFEGVNELVYDGSGATPGKWKAVATATGITSAVVVNSAPSATSGALSGAMTPSAEVSFLITGQRADGSAINITKKQTLTRSDMGISAKTITLSGPQMFKYDTTGTNVSPSSITVTSTRQNIAGTTYTWTFGLDGATPSAALSTFAGSTFGTDTATITAASAGWGTAKSITIKAVNGTATDTFTIYKVQDGAHSYLVSLEATSNIMTFDYLGTTPLPTVQTITLTAIASNLTAPTFSAVQTSAAGVETAFSGFTGTGPWTLPIANWPATAVRIKFTATSGAYSDSVTIIKVCEATNAVAGYLTNESITLGCNTDGSVIGAIGTLTTGTFKAFYGTTALTTPAVAFTEEAASEVGCTASINATTGVYSLSAITADTATVAFRATHVASGAYVIKTLTVSRSKTGVKGDDAVTVVLWAPLGDVFKNIGGVPPTALTLQADLYKAGALVSADSTAWYIQDGGPDQSTGAGPGWTLITTGTLTGITGWNTKTITVPASAVSSLENFKSKVKYGTPYYYNTITLTDMTDPYQISVLCDQGTAFFNGGGGSKTLRAVVRQSGTIVDPAKFSYAWTKWVGGVSQGSAGTTNEIVVPATAVDSEASYTCDIDYV